MQKGSDNLPCLGLNSKRLGVRILGFNKKQGDVVDTAIDDAGNVYPGRGMSVTPPCIKQNIKDFSITRISNGKTVLWEIDEAALAPLSLKFVKDSDDHGLIEPAHKMAAEKYVMMIEATRNLWRESDDL